MRCNCCQTEGHAFIYSGKNCCDKCYSYIFESPKGFSWESINGNIIAIWTSKADINNNFFTICFRFDQNKTIFIRQEAAVLELQNLMPITEEFFEKVSKNLKIWQTFS